MSIDAIAQVAERRPGLDQTGTKAAADHAFLNRELSWIEFDRRVLGLAADTSLPILDRVRFCAIASSNLDEFFAVRVAELHELAGGGVTRTAADGRSPGQTLAEARHAIVALQAVQDALWESELRPALATAGIRVCGLDECTQRDLRLVRKRVEREVLPLLTPIALGPAAPFPQVQSLALNVGVLVGAAEDARFVTISIPQDVPRYLEVGTRGVRVPIEDALTPFVPALVGVDEVQLQSVYRVTRDADLSLTSDAEDLLEALETGLRHRRFGDVVRVELGTAAPARMRAILTHELRITPDQIYESSAPLGLAALAELANERRPDLKRKPWRPVTARPFAGRNGPALLTHVRRRDLLAHHPYDAYDTSVERFVAASRDPKVAALKATVYRTGNPSRTVASLVEAADAGKHAVCLVELRARFDERRNIEWSRALDRAGVQVVYGAPDLKVHAKLCLLVRRERGELRRYVHIGSGNYHASNASAYEDLSLFTADEDIAADVADVFNAVTGDASPAVFRKLLVAPWFLREGLLHEIDRVAEAARAGEPARIRIKVNALVDPEIVEALYAASRAGASVDLVTRGICVLRPGICGLSEGITVRSVLGPFLEHSRILSFQAGDRPSTWIGSADLMPRNLDRRIEVLAPVEDAKLRARIVEVLDALGADTRFAWQLGPDGAWTRVAPAHGDEPVSAQELLMRQALARAKKAR
ncbi:MAG TPA: polyphosphate kinase 1 [Gaiellaceae bacterium]